MGATGGVGGYAVQMARSRGAHVIATVRGGADEARRLGAEQVYDSQAVDVIDALRADHPDGADAVPGIGQSSLASSLNACDLVSQHPPVPWTRRSRSASIQRRGSQAWR
jgi:NADPH:quinone reductase